MKKLPFIPFLLFGINHLAQAAVVLDFGINSPTSGLINYAGNQQPNPLVGTSIQVDNLTGTGTPLNSAQTVACNSCLLNFITGNLTQYRYDSSSGQETYDFLSGGTFNITGAMSFTGNTGGANGLSADSTLVNGSFIQAKVISYNTGYFNFEIAQGTISDQINSEILKYFDLPQTTTFNGGINLSFSAIHSASNAFTTTGGGYIGSGDIINQPVTTVPIPPAFLLLSSSMIALFALGGYRTKARI